MKFMKFKVTIKMGEDEDVWYCSGPMVKATPEETCMYYNFLRRDGCVKYEPATEKEYEAYRESVRKALS